MNLKIKFRESFRPFAPSVLAESAAEYFALRDNEESPYMLLVAPVHESRRLQTDNNHHELPGLDRLKLPRSEIPAVTHVDYSARVQTVDAKRHGRYRKLLESFAARTGCPVLINTSFNVRGEPIVCTPEDAYRCFMSTGMDVLVLDRLVLRREDQPQVSQSEQQRYVAQFNPD